MVVLVHLPGRDIQTYFLLNMIAAMKSDGSITAWGDSTMGGSGAPTGTDIQTYFLMDMHLLR